MPFPIKLKANDGFDQLGIPKKLHATDDLNAIELANDKIQQKLDQLNWIKNKSMLDLTDLMNVHMDKQPQLLAALQPDIKKNLLYNPALIKTIDQLERQDPLN